MKRLARTTSGKQIYGPKWQNIGATNEIESDDNLHPASVESTEIAQVSETHQPGDTMLIPTSGVAAAPPIAIEVPINRGRPQEQENQHQTGKGSLLDRHQSMYEAASKGDWIAAHVLLDRHPTLLRDEITENGDKALHVAAAMKRRKFVRELVKLMSPDDLLSQDGHGYTACCYAAISGMIEIADVQMKKNPNLGTTKDKHGMTPIYKAALWGWNKMVSYFLESTKVEDLSKEEWFHLLLVTIRRKMYDVALQILRRDGSLATMWNDEGTALHLLAGQDISEDLTRITLLKMLLKVFSDMDIYFGNHFIGKTKSDFRVLAKALWAEIQKLERTSVLELIKKRPILHDAAKVGNAEIITMLTRAYPDLIWNTDKNWHTLFHIAVIYRQQEVFRLIHQIGARKDFIAILQDKNGNNILHLAAKLAPLSATKILPNLALQMRRDLAWFMDVKAIVPLLCLEMRNKKGHRPRELFSMQHKTLLEKSQIWMRNTADSCMLIATLILTMVFAAMFTVPGGNNQETGIPILLKNKVFRYLSVAEWWAFMCSLLSIGMFWSIMTSNLAEDKFLIILPLQLCLGIYLLYSALLGAMTAFLLTYYLVFFHEMTWYAACSTAFVYALFIVIVGGRCFRLCFELLGHFFWGFRHPISGRSLFSRNHVA